MLASVLIYICTGVGIESRPVGEEHAARGEGKEGAASSGNTSNGTVHRYKCTEMKISR